MPLRLLPSLVALALLALAVAAPGARAATETVTLTTPRGEKVEVTATFPEGSAKVPCVVAAPGRGYHKDKPILKGLAQACPPRGLAVVRFDWAYRAKKGEPSADLSREVEDLETVLAWAKAHKRVDAARLVLAGKSLGTIVAHRVARAHPEVKGELLLTPLVASREAGPTAYEGILEAGRRVAFVVGDADAENCPLAALYGLAADAAGKVSIVVVPGDHGLEVAAGKDAAAEKANEGNLAAALPIIARWAEALAAP